MIRLSRAGYRGLFRFSSEEVNFEIVRQAAWHLRRQYGDNYRVLGDGCEWWISCQLSTVHRTATLREAREWINGRVQDWCIRQLAETKKS